MSRPSIVSPLSAALRERPPRSQLLRGGSGFGKTVVAAQVAEHLKRRGKQIVPVVGVEELSGIPLAALAPLLGSREMANRGGETSDRLQALVGIVGAAPERYVLVLDDAPLLDGVSASVVYQLIRVYGVAALLTARDEHELNGPIARLLHEDLVTVTDLDPLTAGDTADLLERYLGAPLRPDTARSVFRATAGNPLFAREIALAAERSGGVQPTRFGIELDQAALPEHVLAPLRSRITSLGSEELHLVRLLALSQPWPAELVGDRYSTPFALLREKGIVVGGDRERVRLAHPLLTEAVRTDDRPVQEALAVEAAAMLARTGEPADRLTAICLIREHTSLRSGLGSSESLEWAAGQALSGGDPSTALGLARAAAENGGGFLSKLLVAGSLSALGGDADSAFEVALGEAAGDHERALTALRWGQHTAYRRREPAVAVARSREIMDGLAAESSVALSAEVIKWRLMAGAGDSPVPVSSAPSHEDALSGLATGTTAAMLGAMRGDSAETRSAIARARPLAALCRLELPYAEELLALSELLSEIADGNIAAARSIAEQRRLIGIPDAAGQWSYVLALIELHAGNIEQAGRLAALAEQQLAWRDFTGLSVAAVALNALARAYGGDGIGAREALDRIDEEARSDVKVLLHAAEAEAWLAHGSGDSGKAGALLCEAVDEGVRQGHQLLAALAASHAVLLDCTSDLRDAMEAAERTSPSRFVALVARAVDAETGARRDEPHGHIAALRGAGLTAVADHATRGGRERGGLALLSPREQEIARAAADRARTREIADRLGISQRTVDNHLARIYSKLGISGRDQLSEALNISRREPGE
ncbi:MAG: LuxR C-terminal-related transcriptional regulator [Leucobacter sp.]